jgi:hypothetical protein
MLPHTGLLAPGGMLTELGRRVPPSPTYEAVAVWRTWHRAGMFEKKQNVFDDFIAAAEWLIQEPPRRLRASLSKAVQWRLLMGAMMTTAGSLGAIVCGRRC